jgi:hypothetical protein
MTDSRKIYRYKLNLLDEPTLLMPEGAEVLSVGPPRGYPDALDLWALVEPKNVLKPYRFLIVGTGNSIPDGLGRFIGTVTMNSGVHIFHVFEAAS